MIRKLMMGAGVAALAVAAIAAEPAPMGDKDLTRDEVVAKVREHFGKMDANHDGVIAKDEIEQIKDVHIAMRHGDGGPGEMHFQQMEKRDPNEMFDKLDTNKDGSISREEFAKGHEMRIEKRVVMLDKMKEAKGDGKMRWHSKGDGPGMHMMVMADTDKDGQITLAEAEAMALKHFDEMDANHDGKVTAEERKAAHPMIFKMREIREEKAPKAS